MHERQNTLLSTWGLLRKEIMPSVRQMISRRVFHSLLGIVAFYILAYSGIYWYFGARFASLLLLGLGIFFNSLELTLDRLGREDGARFIFVVGCLFYICTAPLGFREATRIEYYFLATLVMPPLLFDHRQHKIALVGILLSPAVWTLQRFLSVPNLSDYWIPEHIPVRFFEVSNFYGASFIIAFFLRIFSDRQSQFHAEMERINQELEASQDLAKVGSWTIDLASKKLTWSRQMFNIFDENAERGEPSFERHFSSIHPEDRDYWLHVIKKCSIDGESYRIRFRTLHSNREVWVDFIGQGRKGADGRVLELYGTCQDVSDSVEFEWELQSRNQFLDAVLKNVPTMVFVKDFTQALSFSLLNRAGEELLGVKESDLVGKSDYDFFPKEQADRFTQADRAVFDRGTVLKIDRETIQTPRGPRILKTLKVPTYDDTGAPKLLIGISEDITEELAAKEALERERLVVIQTSKLASLGEMSAGIAHEINNPLAIISGAAALLPKYLNDPEKFKSKLESIERSTSRIARIVHGLRKFSRTSEGTVRESKNLAAIVEEVLTLVSAKASQHSVPIFFHPNGGEYMILCDEIGIEQVLVNLIGNSIDAVKDLKDKWVEVRLDSDANGVLLEVEDSGPGIPEDIQEKLFQPFFTTKPVGQGTGLGLSIAKGILDDHGALIALRSGCENTCFQIQFPMD